MWDKFLQDFKERFMTFETAKGLYLLPAGIAGIAVTTFAFQFILHVFAYIIFGYMIFEGLRKIFVNRVKQKVVIDALVTKRQLTNVVK